MAEKREGEMAGKLFILYDARARWGDTDDAAVMVTADSEQECRETGDDFGADAIWYEYDTRPDGELVNEKMRADLSPNPRGAREDR